MIRMISPEANASARRSFDPKHFVWVEPVYGCRYCKCKKCVLRGEGERDIPEKERYMPVDVARAAAKQLKETHNVIDAPTITYTLRGSTLSHPKLHKITEEFLNVFPKAKVQVMWNLCGVPDEKTFNARTQKMQKITISLDTDKIAGVKRELQSIGLLKAGQGMEDELVAKAVRERIGWALKRKTANVLVNFNVLADSQKELDLLKKIVGNTINLDKIVSRSRNPRGSDVGKPTDRSTVSVFYDGVIKSFYTP